MKKQIRYYENKLKYETDAWDLFSVLSGEESVIVVDARSSEAFNKASSSGLFIRFL